MMNNLIEPMFDDLKETDEYDDETTYQKLLRDASIHPKRATLT